MSPPDGGAAPRAAGPERPDPRLDPRLDPWGRREGRNNDSASGPWAEQPGPWNPRRNAGMSAPRGWHRPRPAGGPDAAPGWPGRGETLRRIGGFALLGCSLWLVAILAFFQALVGMFS